MKKPILCSNCFHDYGLKKTAERVGSSDTSICPTCGSCSGKLLDEDDVEALCERYFVAGSYNRVEYGGSPTLMIMDRDFGSGFEFNAHKSLDRDIQMILEKTGITPTSYGPDLWRLGITEWMERLNSRDRGKRDKAIWELINRCAIKEIGPGEEFFRIRTNVDENVNEKSYDAPASQKYKGGRLNIIDGVVFYASFDVETCIHECRVSMEDTLFMATMEPCITLRLLDLSDVRGNKSEQTPFEYLSLAINQLFMAGSYSYGITRRLSSLVKEYGLDGIIYPSYFNSVNRKTSLNLALYGQVIKEGKVRVKSIDRILLSQVDYEFEYGPCYN